MSSRSNHANAAFTLFEISIALALVAVAMLSTLLAFPAGLKAQQFARMRIIAATKAEELVEAFNSTHNANPASDTEAFESWDVPVSYRSQTFDLEQRLASHRFGVLPVPVEIARRLDSTGGEIERILDEGGYIYYSQPMATSSVNETSLSASPPSEAQKLVFAVVGAAQNNAIPILPQKNWPYHTPYPSPPMHGLHFDEFMPPTMTRFKWGYRDEGYNGDIKDYPGRPRTAAACPEEASDPDMQKVFYWPVDDTTCYGYMPFAYGNIATSITSTQSTRITLPTFEQPTRKSLIAYIQATLWYAQKKLPGDPGFWNPSPSAIPSPAGDFIPGTPDADKWKQVQVMRFLAHAAACLTGWYDYDNPGDPDGDLTRGVIIPSVSLTTSDPPTPAGMRITDPMVRYYHERCLNLIMKYSASLPYDWGAPRPLQRSVMMDFPLLEYDLFSPPRTGTIWGTSPAVPAAQWKPIPAREITNMGASYQYPDHPLTPQSDLSHWGSLDHFTLAAPFEAAERCRQIVFWAVDWMSYEDFETAPSAPVDASKYAFAAPMKDGVGNTFNKAMVSINWFDEHLTAYRNPEKVMTFMESMDTPVKVPSGTPVPTKILLNQDTWQGNPDLGLGLAAQIFSGRFGADRNFNKAIDRGPLPRSTRMRAVEVVRFNYYDPRVPLTIR